MEENYNNMVYGDQEFKSFKEIFSYGLSLCKWWKKKKAKNFFTAYIYYLYNVNSREDVPTIEYAEQCAKRNFGYFAGYYGDDVRKKVYKYFKAVHPVFGNNYNVTNKEAFYVGIQRAEAKENNKNK